MKRGTKTLLIWGLLLGIVFYALSKRRDTSPAAYISAEASLKMIEGGRIDSYRIDGQQLLFNTVDGDLLAVRPPISAAVWQRLNEARIPYEPEADSPSDSSLLTWLALAIGGILALVYLLRKMQRGSFHNIFELRKTKARAVEQTDKARFADIGGNRQAVGLLADVVDFLRAPERWTAAGLRIPRGLLVVGPPGTGKTLLARAVAGETESAFFYTSATEFVELFVGVGAARVRDTFEKAVAQQPAVIFIDELDAIGRRRGSGTGTIHEEREQTLNQLLVLMDGMEQHQKLVVIAATNRPDVLDSALLRSGRFDRVLRLELPSESERIEILKIHTRNKPLDSRVLLETIAGRTDGFTGADLEALTNSAGLLAVRRTREGAAGDGNSIALSVDDFDRALEEMNKSNRRFGGLDSLLVESVSQFAEPVGRIVARVTLSDRTILEGDVLWMNATHIKVRHIDRSEVILAKNLVTQIMALQGTESSPQADVSPDRWAGRTLDVG